MELTDSIGIVLATLGHRVVTFNQTHENAWVLISIAETLESEAKKNTGSAYS
jgi:hypothetical protein